MPQSDIQEHGLNQLLVRRLGLAGISAPAPIVGVEIMPTLALEADRPEWSYLKGELLAGARAAQAAVAAQNSFGVVSNPANSGLIATIVRVTFTSAASTAVVKLTTGTFAGTPVIATVRDGRWIRGANTTARGMVTMTVGSKVGLDPAPAIAWGNASTTTIVEDPIILAPGQSCIVELATVNIDLVNCGFIWRERPAVPGELG